MLSPRMKKFCMEYASGKNATQAYLAVYEDASTKTARANGYQLLKRDDIRAELNRLTAEVRSEKIMDIKEMQERLTAIARQSATEEILVNGKWTPHKAGFKPALRAIELLAKIQGNFAPEKQQVDISGAIPIVLHDDVPEDDEK